MSRNILFQELNINPKIIDALEKYKISNYIQVLTTSTSEFSRLTKLTPNEIIILRTSIINSILLQKPVSAYCLLTTNRIYLSTGCNEIDQFLKGGLVSSWLTELSGESSVGKTQLCLQLCLTIQLDHNKYSALYISTEDVFPNKRLNQICERLVRRCPYLLYRNLMNQIFIEHCASLEEIENYLDVKVPYLLENKRVKLIVIDSIAAIARSQFNNDINKKKQMVNRICSRLFKIAAFNNIFVVLINQVTDNFDNVNLLTDNDSSSKIPALGPSWAHWVHMKIQLFRTKQYISLPLNGHVDNISDNNVYINNDKTKYSRDDEIEKFYDSNVRKMSILTAPHLPQSSIYFFIDYDGLKYIKI